MPEPTNETACLPEGFCVGAATAGDQTEGNNVNSDFWYLENMHPTMFVERSGDACDSYHRYEEDIAMLAGFGLKLLPLFDRVVTYRADEEPVLRRRT